MLEFLQGLPAWVILCLAGIAGLVVMVTPAVLVGQWRKVRTAKIDADLKRDLLARGLPVEEVERLTTPARVHEARVAADAQVRQAQIAADKAVKQEQMDADLQRDLLARGLSVEEVKRLQSADAAEDTRDREEATALANVITSMVQDGELNTDAVAQLLEVFLKKSRAAQERSGRPYPARETAGGAQREVRGDNEPSVHFSERQAVSG
jgi:hypothetical protein